MSVLVFFLNKVRARLTWNSSFIVLTNLIVLADIVYKTVDKVTALKCVISFCVSKVHGHYQESQNVSNFVFLSHLHSICNAELLKVHLARCVQFWQKCPHAPAQWCKSGCGEKLGAFTFLQL